VSSCAGVCDADAEPFLGITVQSTATVPPIRLYLIALESRLRRTCFRRFGQRRQTRTLEARGK